MKRAIVSVWDKRGVVEFARGLVDLGYEILSTGGTERALREAGVPVVAVSSVIGFPEILGGRVKTLHPAILGGILARRDDPGQMKQLEELDIAPVDLVAVNLYPFEETIAREGVTLAEALENIDIGGPTMVRAAAKNFPSVTVVVDPLDYGWVLEKMRAGILGEDDRRRLAAKAFARVSAYDRTIANYLGESPEGWPAELVLPLQKVQDLRYGENPHQSAAFYRVGEERGVAALTQLHGKELSYNNYLDVDGALGLVLEFSEPAAVIVKHNNPCGVGVADTLVEAYKKALATDPVSAFGGIVAVNRPVDEALANKLRELFLEVVVAPSFDQAALAVLTRKKNLRLLVVPEYGKRRSHADWEVKSVWGGVLVQEFDELAAEKESDYRVVTKRQPTEQEWRALRFAWAVTRWVKSNAIVFAAEDRTLGIGAGQMSRVDSVHLAAWKAGNANLDLKGSVLGSDAFFPFRDGVDAAAEAGATAIIQPGGSVRDEEVIQAADEHGMAMVFTGHRHFRH